ncbi:MAG TPA: hypothetical protein P5201_13565 [Aminobacteriaceae bacterium]|nr:hypothetical protein [Aminobacteriaceae bacterium]
MNWYEKPENQHRLQKIESVVMSRKFPQFSLFKSKERSKYASVGDIYWGGKLRTNFGSVYSVAVVYPENFPYGQIKAYIPELIGVSTPHKYVDGHLCLYSNDHGGGGEGFGKETTAATVVGWTAAWLNAWEVYKRTKEWPGR